MTLTKRKLGALISDELPLVPREAEKLVTDIFEGIAEELEGGSQVSLHGFGIFRILDKSSRPGRNPKTGEECVIAERNVCVLKQGTWLKNASNTFAQEQTLKFQN